MPNSITAHDAELLRFALQGYEAELSRLNARIREIQAQIAAKLHKTRAKNPKSAKKTPNHSGMSQAGREAIAAAQRKRWALAKRGKKPVIAKKAPKLVKPRKKPIENVA